jgi:nitric oxide dioxygenase
MIGREAALRKLAQPGGWDGFKPFRVARKVPESKVMTSFILEPEDGTALPQFTPGQYVSVKVRPPGLTFEQIRQYSLSATPNGHQFRISVKRKDAPAGHLGIRPGTISTFLHRLVGEGDTLLVHTPGGENVLDESSTNPVLLMSGARESLQYSACSSTSSSRLIVKFCGYTQRSLVTVIPLQRRFGPWRHHAAASDASRSTRRSDRPMCREGITTRPVPIGFMAAIDLDELGVAAQRRHSEVFSPDESFAARSPSSHGQETYHVCRRLGSRP